MNRPISRREVLKLMVGGVVLTACGQKLRGRSASVGQGGIKLQAAEAYALLVLRKSVTHNADSWREAKQKLAFSFALSGKGDRVMLEDGQGIERLSTPKDYSNGTKTLTDLNRCLYILAAMGQQSQLAVVQNSLFSELFNNGEISGQNTLLLNSLVLVQVLKQSGLHEPPSGLVEAISEQLGQNRSKFGEGWGYLSRAGTGREVYEYANVDNNVMAVLAGLAKPDLLNNGRLSQGWSHLVATPDNKPTVSVASTAMAGWVVPLQKSNWDFIASLQSSDGGFPNEEGDGTSSPVSTAEILALLSAPSNPVFGKFISTSRVQTRGAFYYLGNSELWDWVKSI